MEWQDIKIHPSWSDVWTIKELKKNFEDFNNLEFVSPGLYLDDHNTLLIIIVPSHVFGPKETYYRLMMYDYPYEHTIFSLCNNKIPIVIDKRNNTSN